MTGVLTEMALRKRGAGGKPKITPKSSERRGLGKVQEAAARTGDRVWVNIDDGESEVMRVLDTGEDFTDGYVHRVPMEREDGSTYHVDVMCLDQDEKGVPCPGCRDDLQRRYKFWCNVIWRNAPVEGTKQRKDQIAILTGGIRVAKKLDKMDAKHGLRNRDIEIEREGVKKKTKYDLDWADDENNELSAEDKALEKKKYDFSFYTTVPDFDDFYKSPRDRGGDDDDDSDVGAASQKRDPFGERPARSKKAKSKRTSGFTPKSKQQEKKKTTIRRRPR
jgi:hypothetical protein